MPKATTDITTLAQRAEDAAIDRRLEAGADAHPIGRLPFVKSLPGRMNGRDFWAVDGVGDYALDCILGRGLADEALAYMQQHEKEGPPFLLCATVASMIKHGRMSGVETGYLTRVSVALVGGMA